MKKRFISVLLILILVFSASISAQASNRGKASDGGDLDNFRVVNTYDGNLFSDIHSASWYAMGVQACFEYGLMNGVGSGAFEPGGNLTVAEALKTADILSSIYFTGKASFKNSTPWYQTYVDYALKKGILVTKPSDCLATVTREEFAAMLTRALPKEAFPPVGSIGDDVIPDVSLSDSFGAGVYMLYRAGVLTGCDSFGTFNPFAPMSRAEAAVIVARASDIGFRKSLTLPAELSGTDIYKKSSPAVFYLERYDSEGVLIGIGSGFFISRDGLAVTNYHVIDGASSAMITTADGKQYAVKGICGYDKAKDIAVLQIDGSGFEYLSIADSDQLTVGAHVYAIGSPFGLKNTFSDGVVSNKQQHVNNSDFIQYSAPISMGSGGGPVLDAMGQVVGITCLTVLSGQTLNFAVPMNDLRGLSRTSAVPLISIVAKNAGAPVYYRSYFPVPDYGVFVGTAIYKTSLDEATGVKTYYYKLSDITAADDVAVDGYIKELKNSGFDWESTYTNEAGYQVDVYNNASYAMKVHFGSDELNGLVCRVIAIY